MKEEIIDASKTKYNRFIYDKNHDIYSYSVSYVCNLTNKCLFGVVNISKFTCTC